MVAGGLVWALSTTLPEITREEDEAEVEADADAEEVG